MAQPVEIVPLIVVQVDNKKKKSLHLSYLQLSDENKLGGEILFKNRLKLKTPWNYTKAFIYYANNLLMRLINTAGFSNDPRSANIACSSNNSTQSANSVSSAISATFFTK